MKFLVLLLLVFAFFMPSTWGFNWKIDQPNHYVIVNGNYIPLPIKTEHPSFGSSIMSGITDIFLKAYAYMPSFDFLKSAPPPPENEYPEGAPPPYGQTEVLENNNSLEGHESGEGFFSGITGLADFMMKKSYRVRRDSDKKKSQQKGPVRYFYKPLGQGSFMRYEIPILTPEEIEGEKRLFLDAQKKAEKEYKEKMKKYREHVDIMKKAQEEHLDHKKQPLEKPKLSGEGASNKVKNSKSSVIKNGNGDIGSEILKNGGYSKQYYDSYYRGMAKKEGAFSSEEEYEDYDESSEEITTLKTITENDNPFPCPKIGLWKYDGVYCLALTPIPPWYCKPIDLVQSGKLVICRNKINFPLIYTLNKQNSTKSSSSS